MNSCIIYMLFTHRHCIQAPQLSWNEGHKNEKNTIGEASDAS